MVSVTFSLISTLVLTIACPQANFITDFFHNVFYYPTENKTSIMMGGIICIGLVVGIIYLVKKNCEKQHGIPEVKQESVTDS